MRSLLEYLHEQYLDMLKAKGLQQTVPTEGVAPFLQFAQELLAKQRPSAINHKCDLNYRVTLGNGVEVLIAPEYGQPLRIGGETRESNLFRSLKSGDMAPGGPAISLSAEARDDDPNMQVGQKL